MSLLNFYLILIRFVVFLMLQSCFHSGDGVYSSLPCVSFMLYGVFESLYLSKFGYTKYVGFYVILGMTWLTYYHAMSNCNP